MEKISAVEDFLTCPVCLETFKEPVSLGCHHSFCSVCLHNYWDQNSTRTCPVCRRKVSKDFLDVNFALKELTLSFTQKEQAPGGERPVVCSSHPEQTPLFCLDERRALCVLCVELCERHIRGEFERLHRFLQQEEESVLRALRQEQSRQAQAIEAQLQQIREELCTMEQNLQTVEDLLQRQSVDFLTQYRHTHKDTQTLLSQHSPQLGPGLLINQAKVLANVAFNAWNKMRALVSYSPVTLDPNTAGRRIHLSEDLRGVRRGDKQQVPENPERFCKYAFVLGSEGFSSGSHQWDVEVGDHPRWNIGLAKESVDRKGEIDITLENGLWCLGLYRRKYFGFGKKLSLKRRPQRIRVRLDCDEGKVFFFDA
ncbi:nuclear factor 7, ovary-like, partial [Boleophthalmus pectinirostris]|uniref:nuclear factor 7, ovary-like n=1 Tax=Boleophthalmus pectinirostris TaxID=150288 RepID=UPI00242DC544